jgi:hypothetical protein
MCQPFYMAQRGSQTTRLKLQLFKFWPSTDLKQAWRAYVDDDSSVSKENVSALYLILKVLERINEQFMVRQEKSLEKKNKAAIQAAYSGAAQKQTGGRDRNRDVNYVKYFESSDSEEEDRDGSKNDENMRNEESEEAESESEEEQTLGAKSGRSGLSARQQRAMQRGKKPAAKKGKKQVVDSESEESESDQYSEDEESSEEEVKKPIRGRGLAGDRAQPNAKGRAKNTRNKRSRQDSSESEVSEESESSESEDESRQWDDYCYICNNGGNVLCCDSCSKVAHLKCLKLRTEPTGDWHCMDCLEKQTRTRLTRHSENKNDKKKSVGKDRNAKPVKAKRRY